MEADAPTNQTPTPEKGTAPAGDGVSAAPVPAPVVEDDDATAVTMADLAETHRTVQEVEARLLARIDRIGQPPPASSSPAAPAKRGSAAGLVAGLLFVVLLVAAVIFQRRELMRRQP